MDWLMDLDSIYDSKTYNAVEEYFSRCYQNEISVEFAKERITEIIRRDFTDLYTSDKILRMAFQGMDCDKFFGVFESMQITSAEKTCFEWAKQSLTGTRYRI